MYTYRKINIKKKNKKKKSKVWEFKKNKIKDKCWTKNK